MRFKSAVLLISMMSIASCSVQKHVEKSTTTTKMTIERSIDTTVIVSPHTITVLTPKDRLIRAIMSDSVYHIPDGGNVIEIATKNGITKITVKHKPIVVPIKMREKIDLSQEVKAKNKDVERTVDYKWYIFIALLLVGVIIWRRFVSAR